MLCGVTRATSCGRSKPLQHALLYEVWWEGHSSLYLLLHVPLADEYMLE